MPEKTARHTVIHGENNPTLNCSGISNSNFAAVNYAAQMATAKLKSSSLLDAA